MATWTVSADSLSWTFKLKPGIKFHSGDPCTSAAVKWWFEQARDPKGFYGFKGSYSSVDTVETPDELTTVVKLKHPDAALAYILYTVYSSIHNPKTYEKLGKDAYGVDTVDGTGPFKLKEFTPGGNLVIVRNDAFAWAPAFVKNQGPPSGSMPSPIATSPMTPRAPRRSRRAIWTSSCSQPRRRGPAEAEPEFHRHFEADAGDAHRLLQPRGEALG